MDSSLRKLADVGERKLENLKRWDKDTYDAVVWLRQEENRKKFKAPIIEPPCLCLSVKDKRFTNAVEACFNANQLKVRGSLSWYF
jgi:structural maintenance of chromosomes protein 5